MDFDLYSNLILNYSLMWFLFVRPEICLHLPSDSTSRWTPLVFGCILPTTRADWGLSPVRNVRRKAHCNKGTKHEVFLLGSLLSVVYYFSPGSSISLICKNAGNTKPAVRYGLLRPCVL